MLVIALPKFLPKAYSNQYCASCNQNKGHKDCCAIKNPLMGMSNLSFLL
ncbi:hypothetical protein GXM_02308 [Nostoc sphaeroides CCNUC1]|uniref:Uncharacterized protein n=1 Tax=Nostoc sphaeroides CCNUC1 TaxID=2653204 RepID=A0A5P8VWN5_9NOSO|nr:hypothetical protein GXM_02308 [Nostoc sphaeroides CCNUC1]